MPQLVQDQCRPGAGFVPEAGEERVPIRIGHPVEPGEETGDLRCQALLSTLPPLRDFFNRLLEERVGMRPESRDRLDVSNDVITIDAESLKGQI